nr:GGDEF domain-containing protein [Micromonospora sp. DSM 115978]
AAFHRSLDAVAEHPHEHFAVLFIDLDDFKPVNDRYGHDVGDEVLSVVAARLQQAVRAEDVVARIGGDEFAIIVTGENERYPVDLADRLLLSLRQPIDCRGAVVTISATIGGAVSSGEIDDPAGAVHAADQAMYQAKRQGRDRGVLVGPDRLRTFP